MFSVRSFWCVY